MNSYGKKLMGIALIAALSSGITIGAFSILNKSADSKYKINRSTVDMHSQLALQE